MRDTVSKGDSGFGSVSGAIVSQLACLARTASHRQLPPVVSLNELMENRRSATDCFPNAQGVFAIALHWLVSNEKMPLNVFEAEVVFLFFFSAGIRN